jgi:hypothetical protein
MTLFPVFHHGIDAAQDVEPSVSAYRYAVSAARHLSQHAGVPTDYVAMPASFERAVFNDRFNVIVASDVCMKVFAHVYGYDPKPQNDFGAAVNMPV